MARDRVIYRERSRWPQWVDVIFWGSMVACTYPLLAGWGSDTPFPTRAVLAVGVVVAYLLMMLVLGGTTVLVTRTEVQVHLGSVPLISKHMAFTDIESVEAVRYHPIREFGGWGVRGFGQKQAWTARGDQAVIVHLASGRDIYVGSDKPHRLEERIRTVGGDSFAQVS